MLKVTQKWATPLHNKLTIDTLQDFVLYEMRRRDMKYAEEFAKFAGLSREWVTKLIKGKSAKYPTIDTLLTLSKATGYDVTTLFNLVIPPEERTSDITPEAYIYAQQIAKLTPDLKEVLNALFLVAASRASSSGNSTSGVDQSK